MVKGLVIVPEGLSNKQCKEVGYPYEVSHILHLEDILKYSKRKGFGVLYLSSSYGILFADNVIDLKKNPPYLMSVASLDKWSIVVSEEIVRRCVDYNTLKVVFMGKSLKGYKRLLDILKDRGLNVDIPIMGVASKLVKGVLECG